MRRGVVTPGGKTEPPDVPEPPVPEVVVMLVVVVVAVAPPSLVPAVAVLALEPPLPWVLDELPDVVVDAGEVVAEPVVELMVPAAVVGPAVVVPPPESVEFVPLALVVAWAMVGASPVGWSGEQATLKTPARVKALVPSQKRFSNLFETSMGVAPRCRMHRSVTFRSYRQSRVERNSWMSASAMLS
jgi:hypothetical protein